MISNHSLVYFQSFLKLIFTKFQSDFRHFCHFQSFSMLIFTQFSNDSKLTLIGVIRCFKIFYALFFTETKLFRLAFSRLFKAICAFLHVCHRFTTNSNTPRNYFDFFSKCPGIFGQKGQPVIQRPKKCVQMLFFVFSP